MRLFTRKFIRDNGDELEVDGSFRIVSQTEIEITEYKAWLWKDRNDPSAPEFCLTDAEDERLYDELFAADSTWEYDDG